MAMIYCSQCGKQISDLAPVCPQCGAPQQVAPQYQQPVQPVYVVQQAKPKIRGKGFAITSMVLGIITLFFSILCLIGAITSLPFFNQVPVEKNPPKNELIDTMDSNTLYGDEVDGSYNVTSPASVESYDTVENKTNAIGFYSLFPMLFIYFFPPSLLTLIFGIISHQMGCKLKMKVAGISMGIISTTILLVIFIMGFSL